MSAHQPAKKTSLQDWHPAEVVAALRMKGFSLRQLALLNGYGNPNSMTTALRRPYPLAEAIIAEALCRPASDIWPTRYGPDGKPNRGPSGQRALLPSDAKASVLRVVRNAQKAGGQ
ncbi:MAG: helix-turn-helix domain-containing protein [Pseudomonas sp.]|uniref:helix-turn-helix domain-containing protein n=1 Tax=Stenotrophomonas sp. TaxID=69392 RepID=UPI003D6D5DD3